MSSYSPSATRSSLLSRVRDYRDADGWARFDRLYRPMLIDYARRRGLGAEAAEEIAQQCLNAVVDALPGFRKRKSFRAWLRKLTNHKVADYFARQRRHTGAGTELLDQAPVADPTPGQLWQRRWNKAHLQFIIQELRGELAEHTLRAFELYVLDERPVEEIGRMLGMTANQVYVAKSRVLNRLRQARFREMLDSLYEVGP